MQSEYVWLQTIAVAAAVAPCVSNSLPLFIIRAGGCFEPGVSGFIFGFNVYDIYPFLFDVSLTCTFDGAGRLQRYKEMNKKRYIGT